MAKALMAVKALMCVGAVALAISPAMAAEKLLPMNDQSIIAKAAEGKQVDLVFSGSAKEKYFPNAVYEGFTVSEINDTQFCFYSNADGPSAEDEKFKAIARDEKVDLCVKRDEVAAKYDATEVVGASPQPFFSTDTQSCKWVWKTGKGIGLWTETCKFDEDTWSITYNDADDSFTQGSTKDDQIAVLRQYHKKADESPDVILPALRQAKLIPDDDECKFEMSKTEVLTPHLKVYDIMPQGKRKTAYDAVPDDELPDPPCGDVGVAVDYLAYWVIDDRHPDRLLFINLGQDGSMFDPYSLVLN